MRYYTISKKYKVVKRVIIATNCGKMEVKRTKKERPPIKGDL